MQPAAKSVMSRLGPLTPQQRQDMLALIAQGIDAATARAIVQGYAGVQKADAPERPGYHAAYVAQAKATLPDWQHKALHNAARASAGGHAAAVSRQAVDAHTAALAEIEALHLRIGQLQQEVDKSGMSASDVHVPVPLEGDKRLVIKDALACAYAEAALQLVAKADWEEAKHPRADNGEFGAGSGGPAAGGLDELAPSPAQKPVKKSDAQALAYAQAAYALQAPIAAYNPDAADVPPDAAEMMQANRLVAGMDTEMAAGAASPDEARRRASRALVERPGLYDGVGATPRTDRLVGLQLDLGSGTARAPGHIGLDLGTFGDYGNAIHDVNLGLGEFSDGSAKAVRLVNSLHDILGEDGDPVPLLVEVQRVLCEGGQLTYVGPEPLYEDEASWPCPGLLLVGEQGVAASAGEDGVGAVRQVFERVPPRVPAYHGADADYQPAGPVPIDVAMAMAAYNQAPARMAMANLVHKSQLVRKVANCVVPIAKTAPYKQIVYGVALVPGVADMQGDVMTQDDIEAAAHGYLGTSRVIGSEHGAPIEAHPVESYIAPQDLTFDGPQGRTSVPKGSWILGVKITDPGQWARVLSEDYNAFSVGGFGLREDL